MTRETQNRGEAGSQDRSEAFAEAEQLASLFDQQRLAQPRIQPPPATPFPTVPYLGPVAPPPVEPPPAPTVRDFAGRILILAVVLVLMVVAAILAVQRL